MFAAQEAQESVVEILIENGADIDIDNNVSLFRVILGQV